MREAKLLYRSLAWRTITLARLRATDASGIKLSDPLLLPSDIGPPMGVQPNAISQKKRKRKRKERRIGIGGWAKNLVVFVDVVGVVSARRNDESLPRLSVCCSGYAAAVTVRSLALWIHEGQGQSESPSDATSAGSDRPSALCVFAPSYTIGELEDVRYI